MKFIKHTEDIFTVKSILSSDYCDALISDSEKIGYIDAPITMPSGPVMAREIRNNTRVIYDDFELAEGLWNVVKDFVPEEFEDKKAIGLNERFRFYRYDSGQRFNWHYDGCFRRESGEQSYFTLMFYLNDGYEGGTTEFEDTTEIVPQKGDALIFWHYQRHIGNEIVCGRKYVLRTDVMYSSK